MIRILNLDINAQLMSHFQWTEFGVWYQRGITVGLEPLCVLGVFN